MLHTGSTISDSDGRRFGKVRIRKSYQILKNATVHITLGISTTYVSYAHIHKYDISYYADTYAPVKQQQSHSNGKESNYLKMHSLLKMGVFSVASLVYYIEGIDIYAYIHTP